MKNMVSGFRRSLSLPPGPAKPPSAVRQHLRSISLPGRFHPLVSQLDSDLHSLRAWLQSTISSPLDGLTHLDHLHTNLDDLLHLPHALDTLRRLPPSYTDRLLDDFLRLTDAYNTFRFNILSLRQHQASTHIAIRRGDDARTASCVRGQRRAEQDLAKLASTVREVSRIRVVISNNAAEGELVGIMMEAVAVTAAASASIFLGIVAASASAVSGLVRKHNVGPLFGRRGGKEEDEEPLRRTLERFDELMQCMVALEEKGEGVFRSLINTRVSLLNILAPSL